MNTEDTNTQNQELRAALIQLEKVGTRFLAGGYNSNMAKGHQELGNALARARQALAFVPTPSPLGTCDRTPYVL